MTPMGGDLGGSDSEFQYVVLRVSMAVIHDRRNDAHRILLEHETVASAVHDTPNAKFRCCREAVD